MYVRRLQSIAENITGYESLHSLQVSYTMNDTFLEENSLYDTSLIRTYQLGSRNSAVEGIDGTPNDQLQRVAEVMVYLG